MRYTISSTLGDYRRRLHTYLIGAAFFFFFFSYDDGFVFLVMRFDYFGDGTAERRRGGGESSAEEVAFQRPGEEERGSRDRQPAQNSPQVSWGIGDRTVYASEGRGDRMVDR